jgi:hypothetical protein
MDADIIFGVVLHMLDPEDERQRLSWSWLDRIPQSRGLGRGVSEMTLVLDQPKNHMEMLRPP